MQHDEKSLKWFDRQGVARPTHLPHGVYDTPDKPLSEQLTRLKCRNWRLEGNLLKCDTDQGPLVQSLPSTEYICHGDGPDGLPLLTRISK